MQTRPCASCALPHPPREVRAALRVPDGTLQIRLTRSHEVSFMDRLPSAAFPATIAFLALLSWGCGGDAPPPEAAPEGAGDLPAETGVEAAPSPMDTMLHVTIALEAMNGSGVTGEAMAMHSDDAVVVILEVEGLPGEGSYNAHIHAGSCADGGPVLVALNPVTGLADGTGTSTTTLEADDLAAQDPHFIMVHGEGGTPLACGDMEGHGDH